jgi:protein-disulfide isomerase
MIRLNRRIATAALLCLGLAAAGPLSAAQPLVRPDDMTLGSPKAPVTVIEYASASCPHCARFSNEVFPAFKAKYIDTGQVRYVFREYLTDPVEVAAAGFMLARCAGKDKYFKVLGEVFRDQEEMYQSGDLRGVLLKIGEDNGLTEAQYTACLTDDKAKEALFKKVDGYYHNDHIDSTPTFLIGAQKLEGEQSLAQLDAAIAKARRGK